MSIYADKFYNEECKRPQKEKKESCVKINVICKDDKYGPWDDGQYEDSYQKKDYQEDSYEKSEKTPHKDKDDENCVIINIFCNKSNKY